MSLKWARLIAMMPLVFGGGVFAQSANETASPLASCSQSARLADEVCRSENDPRQRADCFRSVSAAQLRCLENKPADGAAASLDSSTAAPSVPPNGAVPDVSKHPSPEAPRQKEVGVTDAKPVDNDPLPNANDTKPAAAQETAVQQQKPIAARTDEALPQSGNRAADPATTAALPKPATTGIRKGGLLCMQFRTYDAASGTYRGYDGRVRECRQDQGKLIVK